MDAFSLFKLPQLPILFVIGMMNIEDVVKLAICSKFVENRIKSFKIRLFSFTSHLKSNRSFVRIRRSWEDDIDICYIWFNELPNYEEQKELDILYKDENGRFIKVDRFFYNNTIQGMIDIKNWFLSIFNIKNLIWALYLEKIKVDKELLSLIHFKECRRLIVVGGSIDSDFLTYIMDEMNTEQDIHINSAIPLDFEHNKAFKFSSMIYNEARWMTIYDLLSVRNCFDVVLDNTNFDCSAINHFLYYWVNCEEDMMKYLEVKLRKGFVINSHYIFKWILSLKDGVRDFFITPKNVGKRKRVIGKMTIFEDRIVFRCWDPKKKYSEKLLVLKLLQRQKCLTIEYKSLCLQERKYLRDCTQTTKCSSRREYLEEELKKIGIQKKAMEKEFNEIVAKLHSEKINNFRLKIEY